MGLRKLIANEGYIWAFKDENGNEILLSNLLYLGKEDDGTKYYQVKDPETNNEDMTESQNEM